MPKFETPFAASNAGYENAVLTGKGDLYSYENGKRTNEKIGTKWTVALQGNRLLPLTIKIQGNDPLPDVTDEQITEICKQKKYVYIKPLDCAVSIYAINGSICMSATASGVELVNPGK